MKIILLTRSGQSPTKKFTEKLLNENLGDFKGRVQTMSGAAYNVPSVLSAGIDRGEVDSVFVINPSIFPPSAYELAVFKKPALGRYREALKKAGARQTSWDIAMHLAKS